MFKQVIFKGSNDGNYAQTVWSSLCTNQTYIIQIKLLAIICDTNNRDWFPLRARLKLNSLNLHKTLFENMPEVFVLVFGKFVNQSLNYFQERVQHFALYVWT